METTQFSKKVDNGIALITIVSTNGHNVLFQSALKELDSIISQVHSDDSVVAAVITGQGRIFSMGADINRINSVTPIEGKTISAFGQKVLNKIEFGSKPFIAAVNGFAFGGGFELALACHVIIASSNSRFSLPEIKLGIFPGFGGTQRLARISGKGAAVENILSGKIISSSQAFEAGIINTVCSETELLDTACRIAGALSGAPEPAGKLSMEAMISNRNLSTRNANRIEAALAALSASSIDKSYIKKTIEKLENRQGDKNDTPENEKN